MTEQLFDVFLAHNSVDKPQVRAIATKLRERGLKPWLDEEQIPPGKSFQEEIQKAIPQIKAAAIIIGTTGLGKWQISELRSLMSQFVNRDILNQAKVFEDVFNLFKFLNGNLYSDWALVFVYDIAFVKLQHTSYFSDGLFLNYDI